MLFRSESNPFTLGDDEFFVLGDNSPSSHDSRWWSEPGLGNNGKRYRAGVVPQEYLVGKAFFVFWPGANKPLEKFKVVPYVEPIGPIYGHGNDTDSQEEL
mgnify:CR=1 FL=1